MMTEPQVVIRHMDRQTLARLARLLAEAEIQVAQEPQTGLVMLCVRDPFATDFFLGEILVTTAAAAYLGARGFAMLLGEEPERAVLAAAVDAVLQSGRQSLTTRLRRFLERQARRLAQQEERERRLLAASRVSFETMVKR